MTHARKWKHKTAALVCALLALPQPAFAAAPESAEPIKIAVNEWTGQHLSAHIAARLLEKMGYAVELITAGAVPQFLAIAQGEIHANPEIWDNSISDAYTKGVESGDILVLGQLGLEPREGWIYPPYMREKCPGLPDYRALYECAQVFATAETFPQGRLITYPADWNTRSKDVVAAIKLPFTPVAGGSEGAMVAEMKSALASESPILMMFWQPHWMFAAHDFEFVKWNPAAGECVEETQEKETACGFEQAGVAKIASKNLPQKWPAAARFLAEFTLTNEDQNRMIFEVDQKKRPLEEVVQEWLSANKTKWSRWIKQ